MRITRNIAATLLLAAAGAAAQAQGYPSKPIRVVVPYPAGGVVDVIARSVGERMAQTIEKLGVPRVAPADQISPTTRA